MKTALEITILGSGTGLPSLDRCAPGYLLSTAVLKALVDCGDGVLRQLLRSGHGFADLDAVFLTHTHADHVADLVPLIHALSLLPEPRTEPLDLFGPRGFAEFVDQRVFPVSTVPGSFEIRVSESPGQLRCGDVLVTTVPTRHSERVSSIAYRFEVGGRSVVISGDGELDPGLQSLARGAELLILDCSFPDSLQVPGHMSPGDCGRLGASAGARTVVLSHLYPTDLPAAVRVDQCRAHFEGRVVLAEDLMELSL